MQTLFTIDSTVINDALQLVNGGNDNGSTRVSKATSLSKEGHPEG